MSVGVLGIPVSHGTVSRSRLAGLQALQGVVNKVGPESSLQLNMWDSEHLNKIIPAFLLNMQLGCTTTE